MTTPLAMSPFAVIRLPPAGASAQGPHRQQEWIILLNPACESRPPGLTCPDPVTANRLARPATSKPRAPAKDPEQALSRSWSAAHPWGPVPESARRVGQGAGVTSPSSSHPGSGHIAADAALLGLHHPVVHRVAGVDLPAESLSVRTLKCPASGPDTSNHATGSARSRRGSAAARTAGRPVGAEFSFRISVVVAAASRAAHSPDRRVGPETPFAAQSLLACSRLHRSVS